jgi:DNA-binding MarR family transcriptional regulator
MAGDRIGDGSPYSTEAIRDYLNRKALAAARHRSALARTLGLNETEMEAVVHLGRAGQLTPTQLGALLNLTSGGVTALVQRLERAGHLCRDPHPFDRRSTLLRLSPSILERAEEAFAPLVGAIDRITADLDDHDRRVIGRFLEQVASVNEQHAERLTASADESELVGAPSPGLWA